jgi:putative colanic acid biosynthesis acetyltransferase WcaF
MKHQQNDRYSSPWTVKLRIKKLLWDISWKLLCSWTPKPFLKFRAFIFRVFGGSSEGTVFIHQSARIHFPWNVTLKDRSAIGERAWIYSLDKIVLYEGSTVAQESFICTGSHDFSTPDYVLVTAPIIIQKDSFIGARAIVLPGVTIAEKTIIGAGAVISKSTEINGVYIGNPGRIIRTLN